MLTSALYFALGMATAGLLALMLAPFFWRRAVRSTRTKIERAVPRTMADIRADKDQLRAEFAMSTRRLELSVERLREKAGEHLVEISDKRDLIHRLADEQGKRVEAISELERREAELAAHLQKREERLSDAASELATLRATLADRARALAELEAAARRATETSEEKTVEIVAKGTEIDNLRDQLAAARTRLTAAEVDHARTEAALAETVAGRSIDAEKMDGLERRLGRVEAERKERLAEIDARERTIDRLTAELALKSTTLDGIGQRLAEAEGAVAEASATAAQLALALKEAGERDRALEMSGAVAGIEAERDALFAELELLKEAHDRVSAENAELRRIAGEDWEAERLENATLRERITDIAGQVARLTRSYRGEMGLAELAALAAAEGPGRAAEPNRTLADRIAALQRSAGNEP